MNNRFPLFVRVIFFAIGLAAAYLVMWQRPEFMNMNMMVATNIAMGGATVMMLGMALRPCTENPWFIKLMFLGTATFLVGVTAIMGIGAGLVSFPSFPSFLFFSSIALGLAVLFTPNRHFGNYRTA